MSDAWSDLETGKLLSQTDVSDPDSRADAVMGMMADGRWEGRRSIAALSKAWGIPRSTIEVDARVAMRSFSSDPGEREMLRYEFIRRCRERQERMLQQDCLGLLLECMRLEAQVLGLDNPELMGRGAVVHDGEKPRATPVTAASLVRGAFGEKVAKTAS